MSSPDLDCAACFGSPLRVRAHRSDDRGSGHDGHGPGRVRLCRGCYVIDRHMYSLPAVLAHCIAM
jgi:hypothetical protein